MGLDALNVGVLVLLDQALSVRDQLSAAASPLRAAGEDPVALAAALTRAVDEATTAWGARERAAGRLAVAHRHGEEALARFVRWRTHLRSVLNVVERTQPAEASEAARRVRAALAPRVFSVATAIRVLDAARAMLAAEASCLGLAANDRALLPEADVLAGDLRAAEAGRLAADRAARASTASRARATARLRAQLREVRVRWTAARAAQPDLRPLDLRIGRAAAAGGSAAPPDEAGAVGLAGGGEVSGGAGRSPVKTGDDDETTGT